MLHPKIYTNSELIQNAEKDYYGWSYMQIGFNYIIKFNF